MLLANLETAWTFFVERAIRLFYKLLPAQRQGLTSGVGVSVGATYLIPTGNGLRPSFAQPVGKVVPAVPATLLTAEGTTLLAGIFRDASLSTFARKPR
jgi:hypothetical protein